MAAGPKAWAVVVPVKRLDAAKTRLAVQPPLRHELALAMALDTVTACLSAASVRAVLVVTDDPLAAARMEAIGAVVVADVPDAGLNPALLHGAEVLARRHPEVGIAAVSSDLPALSADSVDEMLRVAAGVELACVADVAGTGTTALAARSARSFLPEFGTASLRRHIESGAVDVSAQVDRRVRRDVDTVADLADAVALGCGTATHEVLTANPAWNRAAAPH